MFLTCKCKYHFSIIIFPIHLSYHTSLLFLLVIIHLIELLLLFKLLRLLNLLQVVQNSKNPFTGQIVFHITTLK